MASQVLLNNIMSTLKCNDIDFMIDNGGISHFLSSKIALLTIPSEQHTNSPQYIYCTISLCVFEDIFKNFGQKYPKDHIKILYLNLYPSTIENGKSVRQILNQNTKLSVSETSTGQPIRVDLVLSGNYFY